MSRVSWEEYALRMAEIAAIRSEDPYQKVGACALRYDNTVAGVGYNGAPAGININWSDRDLRRSFVVHAELNCLNFVKPGEVKLLALTLSPCNECLKTIAIKKIPLVVFRTKYTTNDAYLKTLEVANVFKIELKEIPYA